MNTDELALFETTPSYVFAKYIASVCASPVELVNLLRMVEYVPTEAFLAGSLGGGSGTETEDTLGAETEEEDDGAEDSDSDHDDQEDQDDGDALSDAETEVPPGSGSGGSGGDGFFGDSKHQQQQKPFSEAELEALNDRTPLLKNTDAMGYLVRSGPTHDDDPTRPPYEISIEGDSTLQSVVKIACCESEGFLSLFNGHLIAWLHDITHALFLQPTIEQSLIDAFNINDDSIPLVHLENPYPPLASLVASHAISNFLLTPLDLVRTRIMVQTGNPYHRKYKSGLTALGQIVREEGIGALYASRRFFPTLLLSTLQPLFKYASPVFITHVMGVDADYQPWLFRAAELAMGVAELLVVLPLETVVRRLECQVVGRFVRGGGGSFVGVDGLVGSDGDEGQGPVRNTGSGAFEGMVRTNAIPYTGMFDCIRRIILEEGSFGSTRDLARRGAESSDSDDPYQRRRRGQKGGESRSGGSAKRRKSGNKKRGGWFAPVSGLYRGLRMRVYVNITVTLLRALSSDDE